MLKFLILSSFFTLTTFQLYAEDSFDDVYACSKQQSSGEVPYAGWSHACYTGSQTGGSQWVLMIPIGRIKHPEGTSSLCTKRISIAPWVEIKELKLHSLVSPISTKDGKPPYTGEGIIIDEGGNVKHVVCYITA